MDDEPTRGSTPERPAPLVAKLILTAAPLLALLALLWVTQWLSG